jgi:hypothetical protein
MIHSGENKKASPFHEARLDLFSRKGAHSTSILMHGITDTGYCAGVADLPVYLSNTPLTHPNTWFRGFRSIPPSVYRRPDLSRKCKACIFIILKNGQWALSHLTADFWIAPACIPSPTPPAKPVLLPPLFFVAGG